MNYEIETLEKIVKIIQTTKNLTHLFSLYLQGFYFLHFLL